MPETGRQSTCVSAAVVLSRDMSQDASEVLKALADKLRKRNGIPYRDAVMGDER